MYSISWFWYVCFPKNDLNSKLTLSKVKDVNTFISSFKFWVYGVAFFISVSENRLIVIGLWLKYGLAKGLGFCRVANTYYEKL